LVKIRLSRIGRKKRPFYRIVVVDSHKRRDSDYIERIGYYHPLDNPATVEIDGEAALKWLRNGAQPTDTVHSLFQREGIWLRFKLEKRNLPEEKINELMAEWMAAHAKKAPVVVAAPKPAPVVVEEVAPEAEAPAEAAEPVADPA